MMKRKCQDRKRVVMSTCRAVVPCDTERLRKARLARYARRKKVLEKLDGECRQFLEVDEPEFTKFMARTFGVEQNAERELEGKIGLCRRRLGIIELLARAHRKSPKAYCFELRGKVTETMDFWAVLEAELEALEERERAEEERRRRSHRVEEEEEEDDDDFPFDEDDFAGRSGFDDDDDDDWFRETERILNFFLHGKGDVGGPSDDSGQQLKQLYRELCQRYHPDRIGTHDAKTQRIWNDIQTAYQRRDIAKLRAIRAGANLESGTADVGCADLDAMIDEVELSIRERRRELNALKRRPQWGFTSWTANKIKRAQREIKGEFDDLAEELRAALEDMERELDKLLHWEPTKRKKKACGVRESHKRETSNFAQPDLFDF